MNAHYRKLVLVIALNLPLIAMAQLTVQANNNHSAMLASPIAKEAANKKLVYDFWRKVLEAGHLDLADQYLTEPYIQHNPEVPTGRAGFVEFFSTFSKPTAIQDQVQAPLVSIVAEGDMVVLSFVKELPDPNDQSKTYTTTWFDMFRIDGNRIAEHWDPTIRKAAPEKLVSIQSDPGTLQQYVGVYKVVTITPSNANFPDDAAIEIRFANNQLTVDMSGKGVHTGGATVLSAIAVDHFIDTDGTKINFIHEGGVDKAQLDASGMVFTGVKQ